MTTCIECGDPLYQNPCGQIEPECFTCGTVNDLETESEARPNETDIVLDPDRVEALLDEVTDLFRDVFGDVEVLDEAF